MLVVFGTRPDAVKMAPVVKALSAAPGIEVQTCVTAQHRTMLDSVLETFALDVDYDMDVMRHNQDLIDVAARVIQGMKAVLRESHPDLVLVHGDTSTSFCAALASFYEGVEVGHVEAGLRTYDLRAPWPEEGNRQLTARISHYHFAPTEVARDNLLSEGVPAEAITVTGNTVVDALLWMAEQLEDPQTAQSVVARLSRYGYNPSPDRRFVLVTGHRRENFGDGLRNICAALKAVASRFAAVDMVYPVHLNPQVQEPVTEALGDWPNIVLLPPVDYAAFVYLMKHCRLVLTDSGGIQEEAPALGKPVLVMRDATERPEAVAAGVVRLVGTDVETITTAVTQLLSDEAAYSSMANAANPFGDGHAAARIRHFILALGG